MRIYTIPVRGSIRGWRPNTVLKVGDRYTIPEDPLHFRDTPDPDAMKAFYERMKELGLAGIWIERAAGCEIYELIDERKCVSNDDYRYHHPLLTRRK